MIERRYRCRLCARRWLTFGCRDSRCPWCGERFARMCEQTFHESGDSAANKMVSADAGSSFPGDNESAPAPLATAGGMAGTDVGGPDDEQAYPGAPAA